jgi:Ca2+-binding RTX toxin-like protein
VVYDSWANHQTDAAAAGHAPTEIFTGTDGVAKVLEWGLLNTVADGGLGQVDAQARLAASAGQDDHFIGGLNPGVSPSNGFFVLFGQFFDHGLDFVAKSSGKTIKIALAQDDPFYGAIGPDGRPVHEITISRATVQSFDAQGPEYTNHTSPYIDQSQTYGSHAGLTTLLREWVADPLNPGQFHAGRNLLDGHTLATAWKKSDGTVTNATLPTLAELRAHVEATGRDALTWEDVFDLRNRDDHGHVISGNSGSALLLDMNPRFDAGHLGGFADANGNGMQDAGELRYTTAAENTKVTAAIATIDAAIKATYGAASSFGIDALTHKLTLVVQNLPAGTPPGTPHSFDGASALFPFVNFADFSITLPAGAVHDAVGEILLASVGDHYIAGDGRVNENFGLTSIHHVFHEEHNFQVSNLIDALHREDIVSGDTSHARIHEFQINTGSTNSAGDFVYANGSIAWNEDKLFLGTKLIVEMEYQHAAVDQYARNVSPNIQEFVGYSSQKNAAVSLEFGQGAFRFGHSTLRETIDTIDPTHGLTGKIMGYALRDAFLSPEKYAGVGPAAILLGMSHQQMNEVDEFVTPALNQGLLGQPLDLAAINIARGRDIGMPALNDFREAIGLAKYTSWTDFSQNMQHPTSLANFIAAYSLDGDLATAQAIVGLADGTIAEGDAAAHGLTALYASDFLSGSDLGFGNIDTWLGGMAEIHQPGGLLGETFDAVFVSQIEALMDGDRFYYLFRTAGQQFGDEIGNAQLKDIVERNTGLTHLNGNIFGYADKYVELAAQKEVLDPQNSTAELLTTGNEHKYGDVYDTSGNFVHQGALAKYPTLGIYSNGGLGNAQDGSVITINGQQYIRDTRMADDATHQINGGLNLDGTPNAGADSNEVIVATDRDDLIYGQGGDDTLYLEGGNDKAYGGFGIDRIYGGLGNDELHGGDNPDLMDGGAGDDTLFGDSSGSDINGSDQLIGGSGDDELHGGTGIDKLFGGTGDDAIYGEQDTDPFTHGNDGNDYVDGGSGGDILYGDNGDDVLVGGADQDQLFGGRGDDILRPGDITGALTIGTDEVLGGDGVTDEGNAPGTTGFDLIDFSDNAVRRGGVSFDLSLQGNPGTTINGTPTQIAAFQLEGVIGSAGDDNIKG